MNECFVVEIFSEALGSEAVFFGDFWWCIEASSVLEMERILSLSVFLYTVENLITLHYSPEVGTVHSPLKRKRKNKK